MIVTLEQLGIWVGVVGAIVASVWTLGRLLIRQFTIAMDTRFAAQDARFADLVRGQEIERQNWSRIEHEFQQLRMDLPLQYVRREDYVRGQTVIEAKLDAIHVRVENVQIQVAHTQGKQS